MSRKKNKKRDRERRRPTVTSPAKFDVGNQVRVKPGTTDPDFTDIPLGGWAGTISEVKQRSNPPTYLIEWNQNTLDHMHPVYRKRCERDDLTLESMWLAETDLELDTDGPVVIEQPIQIVTRPLSQNDQEDRIRVIFALTSNDPLPPANLENLRRYARHLQTHLSFPFQAKYLVASGPFQLSEHLVTVVGLLDAEDCDEEDGVLCDVKERGEFIELPLADLEVGRHRHNRQLIADYSFWFGNCPSEVITTSVVVHPSSVSESTSAEIHPIPFDAEMEEPGPDQLLKGLAKSGLFGAFDGAVMGSLLGTIEGTLTGILVGAVLAGLIGLAIGTIYGRVAGATNRLRYGSLIGGSFGLVGGVLVGTIVGAMVVAFTGTLIGGLVGAVVGKLLAKWKAKGVTPFGGAVFGAGVGAVVVACSRDQEAALLWAVHGAWVGGISTVFLLLATVGFLALVIPPREDADD